MKFAVCYGGLDVFDTSKEAADFYLNCAGYCDPMSSEYNRYIRIYADFSSDPNIEVATDGWSDSVDCIHVHKGDKTESFDIDKQNYKEAIKKYKAGAFNLPKDLKLDEAEEVVSKFKAAPGYHEWLLFKDGKEVYSFGDLTDGLPEVCDRKSIEEYAEDLAYMLEDFSDKEKEAIKKTLADGLFRHYGEEDIKESEETENKSDLDKLIDHIENVGWWVNNESDDNELQLEIGMMSDHGEDFFFTATGKDIEELKNDIREYCYNFDIDEHVSMWIEASQNGVAGVPGAVDLVHDAESMSEYLEELADSLSGNMNESAKEKPSVRMVVDIDWETDGENPKELGLPDKVELPDWVAEDEVADYLSDEFGYLVNGCNIKYIK
jgi:hypothetical protein